MQMRDDSRERHIARRRPYVDSVEIDERADRSSTGSVFVSGAKVRRPAQRDDDACSISARERLDPDDLRALRDVRACVQRWKRHVALAGETLLDRLDDLGM